MKGIPKQISTRADIEHLRSYIGTDSDTPAARAIIRQQLQAIRNTHWAYQFTRLLAAESERAGPEPEYRVMANQGMDGSEIHEYVLAENPGSRLVQLGITLAELDALIEETA